MGRLLLILLSFLCDFPLEPLKKINRAFHPSGFSQQFVKIAVDAFFLKEPSMAEWNSVQKSDGCVSPSGNQHFNWDLNQEFSKVLNLNDEYLTAYLACTQP